MNSKGVIAAVCGMVMAMPVLMPQAAAQVVEDFKSLSSNQYGEQYPMVNSQRIVRGRILAPAAHEVFLQINGINYPMKGIGPVIPILWMRVTTITDWSLTALLSLILPACSCMAPVPSAPNWRFLPRMNTNMHCVMFPTVR